MENETAVLILLQPLVLHMERRIWENGLAVREEAHTLIVATFIYNIGNSANNGPFTLRYNLLSLFMDLLSTLVPWRTSWRVIGIYCQKSSIAYKLKGQPSVRPGH